MQPSSLVAPDAGAASSDRDVARGPGLADLATVRLVERTDAGHRLGGRLFELGMCASVERRPIGVATPLLENLYERTHPEPAD